MSFSLLSWFYLAGETFATAISSFTVITLTLFYRLSNRIAFFFPVPRVRPGRAGRLRVSYWAVHHLAESWQPEFPERLARLLGGRKPLQGKVLCIIPLQLSVSSGGQMGKEKTPRDFSQGVLCVGRSLAY